MNFCGTTLARNNKQKIVKRLTEYDHNPSQYFRFEVTKGTTAGPGRTPVTTWEFCEPCSREYDRLFIIATPPVIDEDPL